MKTLGLQRGKVKLLPYNPKWKELYKKEEKIILSSIKEYIKDIQHIGSTAIPGIYSKPIIDIGVAIKSLKDEKELIKLLEKIDYEYKGDAGVPGRLFFVKGSEKRRLFYLHCIKVNSLEWKNILLFRNYLKKHKNIAEEYSNLKKKLADKFSKDRESYSSGKDKFIKKIINKANKLPE